MAFAGWWGPTCMAIQRASCKVSCVLVHTCSRNAVMAWLRTRRAEEQVLSKKAFLERERERRLLIYGEVE